MTPEMRLELETMVRQMKAVGGESNFGADPKARLLSIYLNFAIDHLDGTVGNLLEAVKKLDDSSTRLARVNIFLTIAATFAGFVGAAATVIALFHHP